MIFDGFEENRPSDRGDRGLRGEMVDQYGELDYDEVVKSQIDERWIEIGAQCGKVDDKGMTLAVEPGCGLADDDSDGGDSGGDNGDFDDVDFSKIVGDYKDVGGIVFGT